MGVDGYAMDGISRGIKEIASGLCFWPWNFQEI